MNPIIIQTTALTGSNGIVDLATYKAALNITHNKQDAFLNSFLSESIDQSAIETDRPLTPTQYTMATNVENVSTGALVAEIPFSVDELVSITDAEGHAITGSMYIPGGYSYQPRTTYIYGDTTEAVNPLTIVLNAGIAPVPVSLSHAVYRRAVESYTFRTGDAKLDTWKVMLEPYRRILV